MGSVATVPLLDQDGRRIAFSSWSGKVLVLDFIYTGCGDICPLRTAQLADVQRRLGPDLQGKVQFVSVSIDPEHDDASALRSYGQRYGADFGNWSFLTGKLGAIARVAAAFEVPTEAGTDPPSHVSTLWIVSGRGDASQLYVGDHVDEDRLLSDLTRATQDRERL